MGNDNGQPPIGEAYDTGDKPNASLHGRETAGKVG